MHILIGRDRERKRFSLRGRLNQFKAITQPPDSRAREGDATGSLPAIWYATVVSRPSVLDVGSSPVFIILYSNWSHPPVRWNYARAVEQFESRLSYAVVVVNAFFLSISPRKELKKKKQGITPFARKSNLFASTSSGQTTSPAWSWAMLYVGSDGGGGGGGGNRQEHHHAAGQNDSNRRTTSDIMSGSRPLQVEDAVSFGQKRDLRASHMAQSLWLPQMA